MYTDFVKIIFSTCCEETLVILTQIGEIMIALNFNGKFKITPVCLLLASVVLESEL
jgi:hypothetical protein